ncbi:Lrp/AsnC ligand binding domain-containing protein [Candidatus Woesearchaeota archaeon]|nr:Lrp/AsnC ligand binding domain-containing protein [Candidatus Woesearchaeota archaeon]
MLAYVLVALATNREKDVFDALSNLPQVRKIHILFGEWDMIVEVQCASPEDLADFVMNSIRTTKDVKLTSTLIVAQ